MHLKGFWDRIDAAESGTLWLMLKYGYSQREDVIYSVGGAFTHMILLAANQKSSVVIDGRAIFNMAQSVLQHGKKALAIEQPAYVNGKLPSGWNDDTLDKYILWYVSFT
jgi:hypothetical protein